MTEEPAKTATPEPIAPDRGEPIKRARINWRRWRKRIFVIASLTIPGLGALWTFGQFYFQNIYIPATLPVTMALSADIAPVSGNPQNAWVSSLTGYQATIHAANFGQRRVVLLAAWYQLWGYHLAPADTAAPERVATGEMGWCGKHIGGLYARERQDGGTLIETGHFLDGWALDPGESTDVKPLFILRASDFDFLRLQTHVTLAKGTALEYKAPKRVKWSPNALSSDTSGYCESDLTGSLTDDDPIFLSSWQALNQSVLPIFQDHRWIGIEWHAANDRYHMDGSTDRCSSTDAPGCVADVEIGKPEMKSAVWPFVGVCADSTTTCQLLDTMSDAELATTTKDFGLVSTSSSVDLPLWGTTAPVP